MEQQASLRNSLWPPPLDVVVGQLADRFVRSPTSNWRGQTVLVYEIESSQNGEKGL